MAMVIQTTRISPGQARGHDYREPLGVSCVSLRATTQKYKKTPQEKRPGSNWSSVGAQVKAIRSHAVGSTLALSLSVSFLSQTNFGSQFSLCLSLSLSVSISLCLFLKQLSFSLVLRALQFVFGHHKSLNGAESNGASYISPHRRYIAMSPHGLEGCRSRRCVHYALPIPPRTRHRGARGPPPFMVQYGQETQHVCTHCRLFARRLKRP